MSKKVVWPEAKVTSSKTIGNYRSYADFVKKANEVQAEQQSVEEYFKKAEFPMTKLLEIRLNKRYPLIVMRPLRYQSSVMIKSQNSNGEATGARFEDQIKTIYPGTQLMLKSLDITLQEFIFEDAKGEEHCISFVDKKKLLTQTDIFETVKLYFENNKGE